MNSSMGHTILTRLWFFCVGISVSVFKGSLLHQIDQVLPGLEFEIVLEIHG